jgi:ribulose kinase
MGVDVGTGSARVCLIDSAGAIKAVHSKDTRTWNPAANVYVSGYFATGISLADMRNRSNQLLIYGPPYHIAVRKSLKRVA